MKLEAWWYLMPTLYGFWRWQDSGRTIAWRGGQTLTFDVELETVVAHIAAKGLPSFDLLLLLIAATRNNWPEASIHPDQRDGLRQLTNGQVNSKELCEQLIWQLDRIHRFDRAL